MDGDLVVLGLLRLMAYNLLQWARKRRLRHRRASGRLADPPSWKSLFRWVQQVLHLALEPPAGLEPAHQGLEGIGLRGGG